MRYTAITSPIAGRTGVRMIDAGNIVHATDTTGLVVVTQIEPISVLFTLPEDDFGAVNRQMVSAGPARPVAASSRADNKVLGQGTLLLINNQIDQTTGTIQLKATFPNKDHALWPGQFVDAQLLVRRAMARSPCRPPPCSVVPRVSSSMSSRRTTRSQMRPIKVSAANAGGPDGGDRIRAVRAASRS